ncbi:MAG: hypothetical protein BJ554DRAFT_3028 [Olpidium bornovanus]|uniref:Uncharacterized protein n=1 Tax=Olpidium bornovanus TaxID=278681 RepID=A0A8H8A0V6_9FUNG|nr:MAG: hypothetical protein BJ554DRAFT_3028 [Olpidium bornovanus]
MHEPAADKKMYQAVISLLLYLGRCTRPDITVAFFQLARHYDEPSTIHMIHIKPILQCHVGAKSFRLCFRKKFTGSLQTLSEHDQLAFEGFVDADWAGDTDDLRARPDTSSTSPVLQCTGALSSSGVSCFQPLRLITPPLRDRADSGTCDCVFGSTQKARKI